MSYRLDADIRIDALLGHRLAHRELSHIAADGGDIWIDRMAWIEVLSKGTEPLVRDTLRFLQRFGIDEIDHDIALRAAALRRERPKLRSLDAIIFATAQANGRILVTCNTKDFPVTMPGVRVPYTL